MKFNVDKFLLILIFTISYFVDCKDSDTTAPELPPSDVLAANAGPDRTTITGSYAILDGSKSTGNIDWYVWEQDESNPDKIFLFSGEGIEHSVLTTGFVKEGIYNFSLVVKRGKQVSAPDELKVTVKPNPYQSYFEDPNLEIIIRYILNKPDGAIAENQLLSLDSLYLPPVISNKVSSLNGLEFCKNLVYLEMGLQNIADISPIAPLTKLVVLNLTQNRLIADITALANLTNLEWLDLDSNLIEDISSLTNLTKLKYLNLQLNPVKSINALENMHDLEKFLLFQAVLDNISALANLTKLKQLWIIGSGLHDISVLENLTDLQNLHLADNDIEDISAFTKMKKLEWLALDLNNVSNILPLKSLPNLRYIRLWDNQISEIKPLIENPAINKGDIVGLDNNPLNEKSINEYIPALLARGVYVTW